MSTPRRAAPHELQFLRSLGQSLGIHPPMANGRATELDLCRGRVSSRGHFSNSASDHPSATADERVTSQLLESLNDHRSVTDAEETPTSSPDPFSVSILPLLAPPANIQAPAILPSTALHVVSCADLNRPKSAQPRITTNASSYSSSSRYRCNWEVAKEQPCGKWIEGGSKEVWIHVRTAHGLKGHYSGWCHCRWSGCLEKLRVSSLQRHLAKHLDIRWRCSNCDMIFARCDYVRRHIKLSKECHGACCFTLGPRENDRESCSQCVDQ